MEYNPQIHHRRSIRLTGYDYSHAGLYFITLCCADRKCRFGHIVGAGFTPAQCNNESAQCNNESAQCNNAAQCNNESAQCNNESAQCNNESAQCNNAAQCNNESKRAGASPAPTMALNELGQIARDEWMKLPERFTNFEMDVFQIMPNHMHAIIVLNDVPVGAGFTPAQNNDTPTQNIQIPAHDHDVTAHDQNYTAHDHNAPAPAIGAIIGAYKSLVSNACLEIFKSKNETMDKLWQRNYYEHIIRDEISLNNISEYIINNPLNWETDQFFVPAP